MIFDALDETVNLNRSARIAIVGAGPSGMTLARELARDNEVLLIEGGGLKSDPAYLALLEAECVGLDYPLSDVLARQLGGASALWAGYCAQLDSHDFKLRNWVPDSGWPFDMDALLPYYARTAELLNLGDCEFDVNRIATCAGIELPFDERMFASSVWRFGVPTLRFGEHLRETFEKERCLSTLIHANVVDIYLDAEHSAVTELVVRTLNGREGRIRADFFVLACGGIETPRLLLNACGQVPYGVGNSSGLVGRYFMEHPHWTVSNLQLTDAQFFQSSAERCQSNDGRQFMFCFGLSAQAQADIGALNARAHIYRTPAMSDIEPPRLGLFLEQAPNVHSKVDLSNRTDALGMRRARLDWCLTELDRISFNTSARLLVEEFVRVGAGRNAAHTIVSDDSKVLPSNHQLGTTRMSTNPANGVVDAQCRLHDTNNAYIISGSVFPTVGWANPTFTLLALTFRLADTLRERLGMDTSEIGTIQT